MAAYWSGGEDGMTTMPKPAAIRCRVCGCPVHPLATDPCKRGDLCRLCDRMIREVSTWLHATYATRTTMLRELDRRLETTAK